MNISDFDSIRPWNPEDLPAVYDRLLQNEQFVSVVHYLYPGVPLAAIEQKMRACKSCLDFQKAFCYDFIQGLMAKASKGYTFDFSAISNQQRYTFISNHRDIVLDSALLDEILVDAGFSTTCEIAIGDNLLTLPWVKDLVRLNKAFIVERGLPMRQMLLASKRLSEYMHYAIAEKQENIWIAQREGRAKDSNDRTNKGILQMMAMGGEGSLIDRLLQLHLVPLAISYEYDPCDFLKAAEFQQKRDNADWKKGPMDDVISMQTGILGYKGRVHYHACPCLDDYLRSLNPDTPKGDLLQMIAEHIDSEIHAHYELYPCNYIAIDELHGTALYNDMYAREDKEQFDAYIAQQIAKIDLPQKDDSYLRERILTMYANPALNKLSQKK